MESKKVLVNCFKWLAFFLCTAGFLWKTSDSFISYLDADIGTKIVLRQNYETKLPAFAFCRHPNRFLQQDVLRKEFNLTGKDLRSLRAYKTLAQINKTLLEVFDRALINGSSFIDSIYLLKQGKIYLKLW